MFAFSFPVCLPFHFTFPLLPLPSTSHITISSRFPMFLLLFSSFRHWHRHRHRQRHLHRHSTIRHRPPFYNRLLSGSGAGVGSGLGSVLGQLELWLEQNFFRSDEKILVSNITDQDFYVFEHDGTPILTERPKVLSLLP